MSFNLNPLNNNIPNIRTSSTTDGGAGNLGYFNQNSKKQENEKNKSLFNEEKKGTVSLSDAEKLNYSEPPFLLKLVEYIKNLFRRLLHQ